MSVFEQLSARRSLDVSDITNALKSGDITVAEAASLLDHVRPKKKLPKRGRAKQEVKGQLSMVDDEWLSTTPKNSYQGLKEQLVGSGHEESYLKIMELKGVS